MEYASFTDIHSKLHSESLTAISFQFQWLRVYGITSSAVSVQQDCQLTTHNMQLMKPVELQPNLEDTHIWQFSNTGQYSTKSAYEAFSIGSTHFSPWKRIWRSWSPGKCKFFMWTVAHNKCWTADRLARKGLPHPVVCPFCDQAEETLEHLLIACVFSPTCLVHHLAGVRLAGPCSSSSGAVLWFWRLMGKYKQEGLRSRKEGLELHYHFRSLVSLESSELLCFLWN